MVIMIIMQPVAVEHCSSIYMLRGAYFHSQQRYICVHVNFYSITATVVI